MASIRFQRAFRSAALGAGALLAASLPAVANHHFHHGPPSPPTPPPAPPVHHHRPPTPPTSRPPTPPTQQILERQRMQNAVRSRQSLGAATLGGSFATIDDKVGGWGDFANLSEAELAVLFAELLPENDGFNGGMVKTMLMQQIQLSDAPPDVQRQMIASLDPMVSQMGSMIGASMASFPQDMAREFKQIYAANCCGQAQFIAALGAAETKVANKIRADFARGMALPPGMPPSVGAAIAGNIAGGTTTITYSANDAEIRAAAAMVANGRPSGGGGTQVASIPGGGGNNAPPINTNSVGGSGTTGGTPQVNTPPPGGNTPPTTPATGGGNVQLPPPNIPTTSVGGTGTTGATPQIPTPPPGNTPAPGGNILPPVVQVNPGPGGTPPGNPPNLSDLVPTVPEIPRVVLNPNGGDSGGTGDTVPDASGLLDLTPQGDGTVQDLGDPSVPIDVASSGTTDPTDQTAQIGGFGRHRDPDTIRDDIKDIIGQVRTDPDTYGRLRNELADLNDELQNSVDYHHDTWLNSDTAGFLIENGGTIIDVSKVLIVGGACLTTGGACAAVIAAGGAFGTADKVAGVTGKTIESYNQRVNAGSDGGLETVALSTVDGVSGVVYDEVTKTLGGKAGKTIGRKGEFIKVIREEVGKFLGGVFKDSLSSAAGRSSGGSSYSSTNSLAYGSIGEPVVTRTGGTVYK